MTKYIPQEFEKKWREEWKKDGISKFDFKDYSSSAVEKIDSGQARMTYGYGSRQARTIKPKFYNLVELPYTSGDLHIGHWFTFTTPDVLSRFKRMKGYDVFFPIGYDAFGLPAENAAIKRGIHPKDWTMKNIENMTKQFHTMGTMLNNWDDVVITCLPEYYRWNQWIFLKMYERGLAYRGKALSNWCEVDQTVLANENIENGNCWRCGNPVVQKEVEQWFLRITDYADRLVWRGKNNPQGVHVDSAHPEGLKQETVDWPMQVRIGQNNWIGRKEGINMKYPVKNSKGVITCFTTAPVNFGMTFIVLAPEHDLVNKIIQGKIKVDPKVKKEVESYYKKAQKKTEMDRLMEGNVKTGVFTGLYATNRIAGWDVPIWISDFVIGHVGTGAVQGCPGHDYKDFEFAKKFNLPIIRVVVGEDGDNSPIQRSEQIIVKGMKGKMVNSKFLNGLDFSDGLEKTMDYAEKKGWGKRVFSYHIRDWSISRQRYWGTPIPIIYCRKCWEVKSEKLKVKSKEGFDFLKTNGEEYAINTVPEKELPVELPYNVDFTPKGKPPLATNEKWLNVKCPKCGGDAKRDAETLDTFFDSAWYWYRYVSSHYDRAPFDKVKVKKLTPVDVYFGGAEHTLGHTLYARFFTKFFHDLGLLDYEEFALKRVQHGVVLGPDGNRMSKSKGNVINPDDQVKEYGADTVRMYLCFMTPYGATSPWSDKTIAGVHRFLNRVWKMYQMYKADSAKNLSRDQLAGFSDSSLSTGKKDISSKLRQPSSNPAQTTDSRKFSSSSAYEEDHQLVAKLQKTIKKVTQDIEKIKMNTAIAAMMEFLNDWETVVKSQFPNPNFQSIPKSQIKNYNETTSNVVDAMKQWNNGLSAENAKKFLQILAPFAPYVTEEIWRNVFGENVSIHLSKWPEVKSYEIASEDIVIPVQVNGKLRSVISVSAGQLSEKAAVEKALNDEKVKKYLVGKKYKTIYVIGKILNFVIN